MCIFQLYFNFDKGDGFVKYILIGEGVGIIFIIDDIIGDIYLIKSLDREQKIYYVFYAQVIDRWINKFFEFEFEFIIKV